MAPDTLKAIIVAFPPTHPSLARALADRGYDEPTPVQSAVLEDGGEGRDLLVSAQTGSGKTVAFGLALADTLLGNGEKLEPAGLPLALIIAPTRELALQVQRELEWLYAATGARVVSCVGGMDPRRERRALEQGAHIVVGTPGRLRDHIERRALDVSALKGAVLDEADEMLDLGFREDLEFILQTTPESRRTLLFSATLPKEIVALASTYQKDALRLAVAGGERGHADIEYRAIRVLPRETEHAVINLLRWYEAPSAIVFCRTREAVRHLHAMLLERGFSAVALSGELSQAERSHALQALRDGHSRVCVATDVAARGIDLPGLALVIHADMPQNAEVLQHRSGRTGRAGRKGVSVLLVPPSRRRRAEQILSIARATPVWAGPPLPDEVRQKDRERFLADPLLTAQASGDEEAMAEALLAERSPQEIAAALVRLYNARLPAPEDVTDPGERDTPHRSKEPREPREARGPSPRDAERAAAFGDSVWFRLSIGRTKNADPKWLLPMICRRGRVAKKDIGSIRIFERETRVQIAAHVAEAFDVAVHLPDNDTIRIDRAADGERPVERAPKPEGPRPQRREGETPRGGKPWHPASKAEADSGVPRKPRHAKTGPAKHDAGSEGGEARPPRREAWKPKAEGDGGFKKPKPKHGKPGGEARPFRDGPKKPKKPKGKKHNS